MKHINWTLIIIFFSPFSISNIEKMSALRANSYVSSKNLECYAFCRPISGTKLLNLGVKFPKLFSPHIKKIQGNKSGGENRFSWEGGGNEFKTKYTPLTYNTNLITTIYQSISPYDPSSWSTQYRCSRHAEKSICGGHGHTPRYWRQSQPTFSPREQLQTLKMAGTI